MLTICQRQNLGSGLWAFFQRVDTGATGLQELRAVNILPKPPIPILDALEPRATPALINPHPPYILHRVHIWDPDRIIHTPINDRGAHCARICVDAIYLWQTT